MFSSSHLRESKRSRMLIPTTGLTRRLLTSPPRGATAWTSARPLSSAPAPSVARSALSRPPPSPRSGVPRRGRLLSRRKGVVWEIYGHDVGRRTLWSSDGRKTAHAGIESAMKQKQVISEASSPNVVPWLGPRVSMYMEIDWGKGVPLR